MKSSYLISYDIGNDNRLSKVFRYLKGKAIHLQYSVFYCFLNSKEILTIIKELRGMINEREDDVRIYPLVDNFKFIVLGQGARIPDGVDIILE